MVLLMTVNPGFGGQRFIEAVVPKIEALRATIARRGLATDIEVDGGVAPDTVARVVGAGANVLVAGSAIFGAPGRDYRGAIQALRDGRGARLGAAASRGSGGQGSPRTRARPGGRGARTSRRSGGASAARRASCRSSARS